MLAWMDVSGGPQHLIASGPGHCGQLLPMDAERAVSGQCGEDKLAGWFEGKLWGDQERPLRRQSGYGVR